MAFGKYIRREREGQEMTLTELARQVEVSIAYLSRIERERENPPPDRLVSALARALGLPADQSRCWVHPSALRACPTLAGCGRSR